MLAMSAARPVSSLRGGAAVRRRERQQQILAATRALFDARGVRDAQIDDIARAVGINRAIVYRHFASKDELFGLTLVDYLTELDAGLASAAETHAGADPEPRLRALAEIFVDFCLAYPAFTDCALELLRRPGSELLGEMSEAALFTLGRTMGTSLGRLADVLREGAAAGDFAVDDADLLANLLYAQGLGAVHLARAGFIVTADPAGSHFEPVEVERVREAAVRGLIATARG